jgi:hypothetical protein
MAGEERVGAKVTNLIATPAKITIEGSDAVRQLVVTATLKDGQLQDRTVSATYETADPGIIRVTSSGQILPLANGTTTITARAGGRAVSIPVTVEAFQDDKPINFANQIVPLFTKLGCNAGGCHGKASGQNGFKLSLLGFEPESDYAALVKEARGRRLFLDSPERSLLLLKPTGQLAHGGGKRLEINTDEYALIRRWIAAGAPYGEPGDPVVTRITVYPEHRTLPRQGTQQLAVCAHYSDGTVEDITRRAQYDSNDSEIAVVESSGLVRTLAQSGEAAIMARYQGHVTVFRATVPLGLPVPAYSFEPKTLVDPLTHRQWQQLGIVPSSVCPDEQFIRRASLDITGSLPTPEEVRTFVAQDDPAKREHLIDALLEKPEYSYYFANKWANILRVKRGRQIGRAYGTFAFHHWIQTAIAADKPYDQLVRDILTAVGDESRCPPAVWYKDLPTPDQFVDNAAQVFLGVRLACAQCHHHPYEKWGQDDYWGLAAFAGRLARKNVPVPGFQQGNLQRQVLFTMTGGQVINKRTGRPATPKPLDGAPLTLDADDDPRGQLADWMADSHNPFFAKAVANRYWAHFFGRGLVDPLDDMRVTNPPSNPDLLDALAKDLIGHQFSLKHLIKTICKSRTYQLSADPNDFNKHDRQNFSRYYPKRLSAEVLFDAVCQVTNCPSTFGLPEDVHAPRKAIMLPDESFNSYFLDVFGRPQRLSACECERVSEANLAQALHLLNSDEVQKKLTQPGGRVDLLARDGRPDDDKIDELFLWTFARPPTTKQRHIVRQHLARHAGDKKAAYENILWALLNTKEFLFNR